ncbi:MAG: metal ABC transporter permease [Lentisphaeria bacterium]|nr:metal ABC transporter permease [Lentisphaeria bacterium]
MPDLSFVCDLIPRILPFECLELRFMQLAFLGLILLAPMAAMMGVQVVNFRMAFFADAISHTAFAGVAIGLILGLSPYCTMPIFAVAVGLLIVAMQRRSMLSSDTIIGVCLSAIVAFGLAVVSRAPSVQRDMLRFLYGDILTIGEADVVFLSLLFVLLTAFQAWGYNRLLYTGLDPALAETHRVRVAFYQYSYAALLSLVVIFSVWWVGVLLVTGLLIVPAAAARNFARSAGSMFWWALIISFTSAVAGFLISAQEWARTATGATIVLIAFVWFAASLAAGAIRRQTGR